jgi:hypothetical protein
MNQNGTLSQTFGWLVGTGPGSGFGLLILICGVSGTLVGLSGYLISDIRNVDKLLPDYDAPPVGLVRRQQPIVFGGNGAARKKDGQKKLPKPTKSPDDQADQT